MSIINSIPKVLSSVGGSRESRIGDHLPRVVLAQIFAKKVIMKLRMSVAIYLDISQRNCSHITAFLFRDTRRLLQRSDPASAIPYSPLPRTISSPE